MLYLHIYIFEKIRLEKYLCSPMYSGGHTVFDIPGIYTMQPLEGCAAYISKWEGLDVQEPNNQAPRHSRGSTSQSEMKGVISVEVWSSFLSLPPIWLTVHWGRTIHGIVLKGEFFLSIIKKASAAHTSFSMPIPSKVCSYIIQHRPVTSLLWPRFTIPVRFGILAL